MKELIKKIAVDIILASALCLIISILYSIFVPTFTNDMALGQLESDNASFMLWETWNRVRYAVDMLKTGIWMASIGHIGFNTYKFYKTKKENN